MSALLLAMQRALWLDEAARFQREEAERQPPVVTEETEIIRLPMPWWRSNYQRDPTTGQVDLRCQRQPVDRSGCDGEHIRPDADAGCE